MKKAYEKPYIYVQSFELSQQIASCEFVARNNNEVGMNTDCYAQNSSNKNEIIFSDGACNTPGEAVCNYTATEAFPVFGSF